MNRLAALLGALLLTFGCASVPADTSPIPLFGSCHEPHYPRSATRAVRQGTVKVIAYVDFDGTVMSTGVVSSSDFADVDEAAQIAIASCRWQPATHAGHPTWGEATMAFNWKLPP